VTREPGRPTRGQIVLLAALSAFGPLSLDMYLPGLPPMTRDLHTTASAAQLTITACMIGLGVGQVIAGPLSDARGRRGPLLAGIAGYTLSSLACAMSPGVGVLVAMRLVQGMAGSAGIVIARAIVRDLSGGTVAARLFGVLMGITGVVPVAAPLIGGQVLLVTSWRGVFVVLAAIGVPLLAATAVMLPESLPLHERHGGGLRGVLGRFGALVRDRRYMPYALAFSLSFAAMFGYISGSSYVLENIFGISPQLFSVIFAVNSGGLISFSLLGSRAVARRGSAWLLRRGLVGTAAASIAALLVTITHAGLWPLLGCFFVLLCANGVVLPNGTASAMASRAGSLGAASALLGLGQFGSGALVAPLVGVAGSRDALPMAIAIAVAGTAALLVDLAFAPRRAPSTVTQVNL
jgi:DHA1 family bicyclomycin/chloramphenicol resistance-like MFS transporter